MVKSIIYVSLSAICLAATLSLAINASLNDRNPASAARTCDGFVITCYLPTRG